jgi:hypothetical protein
VRGQDCPSVGDRAEGVRDVVPAGDLTGLGAVLFNLIGVLVDMAFGLIGGVLFGPRSRQ